MSEEKMTATEVEQNKKSTFEIIIYIVSLAYACFFLYTAFRGPFVSTTQRGFQANSRIITVSDTMLEELINLKR